MANWVQDSIGSYLNLDQAQELRVTGGSPYTLTAYLGTDSKVLAGSWSTAADASAVARKLVDGVDPSTY